jgi:hypothetical protein
MFAKIGESVGRQTQSLEQRRLFRDGMKDDMIARSGKPWSVNT